VCIGFSIRYLNQVAVEIVELSLGLSEFTDNQSLVFEVDGAAGIKPSPLKNLK
jgi:hypothetical protein